MRHLANNGQGSLAISDSDYEINTISSVTATKGAATSVECKALP